MPFAPGKEDTMSTDSLRRPRAGRPFALYARAIRFSTASLLLLMSCQDETAPERVTTLQVEPTSLELMVNEVVQLHAVPRSEAGTPLSGRAVTWTSRNPAIATVNSSGAASAVSIGQTTLLAASEGITAEVQVSVIAAVGEVEVNVNKVGRAADPIGFQLLVDDQPLGDPLVTFGRRLLVLPVGLHWASMVNLDPRCELPGGSPRAMFVTARQRTTLTMEIACLLDGQLIVKTQTTGLRSGAGPYRITLDGGADVPIEPEGELRFDLRPRTYQVALSTLDPRCYAVIPSQLATVPESATLTIQFQVRCYPQPPTLAGEKLLVSYHSPFVSGLDAMDPNGANRFAIDNGPWGAGDAAVSADGRLLAYRRFGSNVANGSNGSNLVVIDLTTGTETMSAVASHISALSWAPDGQRLVSGLFNNGTTTLVVLRTDGTVERFLSLSGSTSISAHWAPDGRTIAVTRSNHAVLLVNPDGSSVRELMGSSTDYFDGGDWSPDGETLLIRSYKQWCYYYYYCYTTDAHLIVLDATTGRELRNIQIPEYAFGFVWGATSDEVYFIQEGDVFHTRLDAFQPVNVTRSPEDEWSVVWGRFDGGAARTAKSPRLRATIRQ